ncbi:MAG: DUF721 domain-containing protein [Nitriliruptoraceae bacterium]
MTTGEGTPRRTPDARGRDRRAGAVDRDERVYERRRRAQRRQRQQLDRASFDPAPPGDDDWTVADEKTDGIHRVPAPQTVGETLRQLVERRGWNAALLSSSVWTHWAAIVGDDLAQRCEPARLHRGVLTIRAYDQPWAVQLRYLQTVLRQRCDEVVGLQAVRRIDIVIGPPQGSADGALPDRRSDAGDT